MEKAMSTERETPPVLDFFGSAHAFSVAVGEVIERQFWGEVAGSQFSVQQLKILKLVALPGRHLISDVAAFIGVSNAAASKAVDKLVQHMLIRRIEGEEDRREIHLTLTGAGRRLLQSYDVSLGKRLEEILGGYTAEELQRMSDMLGQLSARIIQFHTNPDDFCVQCGVWLPGRCLIKERLGRDCAYARHTQRTRGPAQTE
jgi:DNA-binding MarR family transcriptional regulator